MPASSAVACRIIEIKFSIFFKIHTCIFFYIDQKSVVVKYKITGHITSMFSCWSNNTQLITFYA